MRHLLIDKYKVDVKNSSYGCPWKYDVTAHNFIFPEESILNSDIETIDYWEDIQSLVIRCDIDNYDFISKMINLRQLYIYTGKNLNNISFVKKLNKLSHIYTRF